MQNIRTNDEMVISNVLPFINHFTPSVVRSADVVDSSSNSESVSAMNSLIKLTLQGKVLEWQTNMNSLILPNTYIENIDTPLIYLAGPIRSAPDWQGEAIELLFSKKRDLTIASPRMGIEKSLSPYLEWGGENHFSSQREWEWYYMDLASKKGSILFWLPGEEKHHCDKAYAAVTRLELGQWMTRYKFDNSLNMCFGGENVFPEIYITKYDLELHAPDKKVYKTLKETCDEALRLARS